MRLIVDGERTVYENVSSAHPEERKARTLEIAASSSPVVKCVALRFGFRICTPSKVVPSTFEPLRLGAFEVLRAAAFEAFLAEWVTFKSGDLDDLVIEKLCAKLWVKTRILSPHATSRQRPG